MSTTSTPPRTVLLVHGAWHGAWCFAALQAELDRRGIPSLAVDLPGHGVSAAPLGTLYQDAQAVLDALDTIGGETVLVGHSYGGAVITEAGARLVAGGEHRVAHLVYLAALVLDEGENGAGLLGALPPAEVDIYDVMVWREDGTTVLGDPDATARALYGFCDPLVAQAAVARLGPQRMSAFAEDPASGAPWRTLPSTYVHCLRDRTVAPAHQEVMATRCGRTVVMDTDHSPFLSRTSETADLLEEIARS